MTEFNKRGDEYFGDGDSFSVQNDNHSSGEGERDTTWSEEDDCETLEIGFDGYVPHDGNWDRYGQVIGGMKQLKELVFYDLDEEVMRGEEFVSIFNGISRNRSICNLRFHYCGLVDSDIFSTLNPFFKGNHSFKSLKIDGCDLGRDGLHFLRKSLSAFSSLKEFELSQCVKDDDGSLIQALMGHSRLRKLCLRENRIGKNGSSILAALLLKPDSELAVLEITDGMLDDAMVTVLAMGVYGNSTLESLDLSRNPSVTERGWRSLFATLQRPNCRLGKLFLQENLINSAAEFTLAKSLATNGTLKVLDLSYCRDSGEIALYEFLQSPNCKLEELYLLNSRFSKDKALCLTRALLHNRTLKRLDLSACHISNTGWREFSSALRNPHSVLENLNLSSSEINDEALAHIANGLSTNSTLRRLSLCNNVLITAGAWISFFAVLRYPDSALENLDLSGSNFNDSAMISLANSLVDNKKLIDLQANLTTWNMTTNVWTAFRHLLCNKSSIMATHNSNHTLCKLCQDDMEIVLPDDIQSLLVMNRENGKLQTARRKIIDTHFSSRHVNILPFAEMELKIVPFVLAWMAQDCTMDTVDRTCGNGFDFLYQFVQDIDQFYDSIGNDNFWVGPGRKRRKVS